jgi:hypothetical protein
MYQAYAHAWGMLITNVVAIINGNIVFSFSPLFSFSLKPLLFYQQEGS